MSNLNLQEYGSSGHRQGDFREDALGIRCVQAARYQSENPTDDAGKWDAGLHQDKPQGVLQAGGCEGSLSRGRDETVYCSQ